jgi:hypothetical protein
MPTFEKPTDRVYQNIATKIFASIFERNGTSIVETPHIEFRSHDLEMFHSGKMIAAGEIKSRNGYSFAKLMGFKALLWEVERLESLRKSFPIIPVFLIWKSNDDHLFFIHRSYLNTLPKDLGTTDPKKYNYKKVVAAPPWMMKDDHGKLLADKRGILIPVQYLTKIKNDTN